MELTEKRSVISRELKALEPGSLYITIAVPPRSGAQQPQDFPYLPYLPPDLDLASYEVSCAEGIDREEFDWGVYLHRDHGNGTWYGLRRLPNSASIDAGMGPAGMSMPFYTLSRRDMLQSPRLQARVAGLVRVLRVPNPLVAGLTSYLDWLALQTASSATRSFIWASSMYLRARRHLSADHYHDGFLFDTKGFLQEALHLAYKEVWYGLAGQLPRPIMASAFGVELALVAVPAVTEASAGARSAAEESYHFHYHYHQHQWASGYQRPAWEAGSSDDDDDDDDDDSSTLVGDENMGFAHAVDSISIGLSA
ncbi:hypothetical protein ACQKWADRAFT_113515 [Trichoderma austrokoningii]